MYYQIWFCSIFKLCKIISSQGKIRFILLKTSTFGYLNSVWNKILGTYHWYIYISLRIDTCRKPEHIILKPLSFFWYGLCGFRVWLFFNSCTHLALPFAWYAILLLHFNVTDLLVYLYDCFWFIGSPLPSVCLIDTENIKVYTKDGEDYVSALQFEVSCIIVIIIVIEFLDYSKLYHSQQIKLGHFILYNWECNLCWIIKTLNVTCCLW